MNRWTKGVIVSSSLATLVLLGMVMAVPATGAATCPVIDPTCLDETLDDVVDGTTDTVDDVAHDATGTVDDVVDDVTGGGGGEDPGGDPGGGGGGDDNGEGRGDGSDDKRRQPPIGVRSTTTGLATVGVLTSATIPEVGSEGLGEDSAPQRGTFGPASVRTATGAAVMVLLLGLITGFALFQHALDRHDPKLAPDILVADRVSFV